MIIWCSVIEFSDASWKLLLYEERDSPRNGEKYFSVFLAFGTLGGYLHLLNQTRVKLLLVQQREQQLAMDRKYCLTIVLGELKRAGA